MLTIDKVYSARNVLKNVIRKTELIPALNLTTNNKLYLKAENLQKT